jgi:hypothetical protein
MRTWVTCEALRYALSLVDPDVVDVHLAWKHEMRIVLQLKGRWRDTGMSEIGQLKRQIEVH